MLAPWPGSAMLNRKPPQAAFQDYVNGQLRPKHGFGSIGGSMAAALLRSLTALPL